MKFHFAISLPPKQKKSCPSRESIFRHVQKNAILVNIKKVFSHFCRKGCISMSFDGLFTKAMTNELYNHLVGGRITKIHQPFENELLMTIRANGVNHKLLISAHPSYARIQLTTETYDNPKEPPMFCMLLRKHLEGFIVENIRQHELDRIIMFDIKGRNEIGDVAYKQLIVEIMGRHSNIILVDRERQFILDSIKHVSFAVNRHRAILPGQPYILPPAQNKTNPLTISEEVLLKKLDFNSGKIGEQLVQQFSGISPLFAKEVLFHAKLANQKTIPKAFFQTLHYIKENEIVPSLIKTEKKEAFYFFPLQHLGGDIQSFSTLSELLDYYYFGKAERDRVKQVAGDLERFIDNEREKNSKKIEKLKQTLEKAQNSNEYKLYGELLTAHLYELKKGMNEITVINYYDEEGKTVTIPLDPRKTPSENAQSYFTKYQKAKNSIDVVKEQIKKAEEEVIYFDTLLQQVETASPKDIEEMKEELAEQGYLKAKSKKKDRRHQGKQVPQLEEYVSSDGTTILVGKNNKQNEYLTTRLARKEEIWLHTKDIPGSHVVIRSNEPSETTIIEAATIAAYFSKARNSSSVPVDFTKIRHVRKPNGAKPGYVIYDNQQTVYVTPDQQLISKLRK